MPSQLTFSATKLLRDKLLTRNLTPYNKPGVYTSTSAPASGEFIQNDYDIGYGLPRPLRNIINRFPFYLI